MSQKTQEIFKAGDTVWSFDSSSTLLIAEVDLKNGYYVAEDKRAVPFNRCQLSKRGLATATVEDIERGAKFICKSESSEYVILNKYDEGIWDVRVFSGDRIVGEKVLFECEIDCYWLA